MEAATGAPSAAFRTIRHHGRDDPGHRADLAALIDELDFSQRQWSLVGISAMRTAHLLAETERVMRERTLAELADESEPTRLAGGH